MRPLLAFVALTLSAAAPLAAETLPPPDVPADNPAIDYRGYQSLVGDVRDYRTQRRLNWEEFAKQARAQGALLLDARSEAAYRRGHLEGAVNLPFTDFTAESLKGVIGDDPGRPIYIYCNNNFTNDAAPVPMKAAALSLNVQTFVNLYGYGYRNIWELTDSIDFTDPRYGWIAAQE